MASALLDCIYCQAAIYIFLSVALQADSSIHSRSCPMQSCQGIRAACSMVWSWCIAVSRATQGWNWQYPIDKPGKSALRRRLSSKLIVRHVQTKNTERCLYSKCSTCFTIGKWLTLAYNYILSATTAKISYMHAHLVSGIAEKQSCSKATSCTYVYIATIPQLKYKTARLIQVWKESL